MEDEIINEAEVDGSNLVKLDTNLCKVCRSICKILAQNKKGSGFLIKLTKGKKPFYCLMTNEHVINEEMVDSKNEIVIYFDSENERRELQLDRKKRFIRDYQNIDVDITVIELLSKDKITDNYFLEPDLDYINGYNQYKDQEMCIPQYPGGGQLSSSCGKIKLIDNYIFSHMASTLPGSSGSPIFLKDSTKVLGIHKGGNRQKTSNYGQFIGPVVESIKKNLKYDDKRLKIKKKVEIKADEFIVFERSVSEEGECYIGEEINGQKTGKGTLYYKDGSIKYDGDFVNNEYEGKGKLIYENGEKYIGEWLNGKKNGKGIEYYKDDSIKYDGDFVNDKYEGRGKYVYENDDYYNGEWLNGEKNGKGTLYYKNGTFKYDGNFVNDKYEGKGELRYENGEYYIGEWLNNKRDGKGTLYYKDGTIKYDGDFVNDEYEGNGKYKYENGEYYIGEWVHGIKNGKGTDYDKNGKIKYEGDFVNGKKEGKGKYIFENGEYYIGDILDGEINGYEY